ncbi:hypothetical protein [Paraurantiacibacter namhicola]|uniref:Uncharacterized protein n=1 Tax=Paraurantiacibacter namhicola TaxID=645517 RepID=A0A1C7D9U2_9SPHN|nr:hypothetical protein [Paraurantiacibacter namhicola]ANU08197.1 hypothetical protein A6F65_01904 [Paraurantiacibacter namhicola]
MNGMIRPRHAFAGAVLLASSAMALAAPESLLPPNMAGPTPAPTAAPAPAPAPATTSSPVVQPLPGDNAGGGSSSSAPSRGSAVVLPPGFPTLEELERMEDEEIDRVLGLKPDFDTPPAAQRALRQVGVIGPEEGGFPVAALAGQPATLVAALVGENSGDLVSRWGHILMRRTLASRMDAPDGMGPIAFAAGRAALLGRMGESMVARALVQDVDTRNYNAALSGVALNSYLMTGDVLGICAARQLNPEVRDDASWQIAGALCTAYRGDARAADRRLTGLMREDEITDISGFLAQRYAGAAGEGRQAVTIEWDGVERLTPWSYSLARTLGVEIPANLRQDADPAFDYADVLIPATPLADRVAASGRAAERGILSSAAMVDLYSQAYAAQDFPDKAPARALRRAYVGETNADRLSAMRELWGEGTPDYGMLVLTATAAARLPVDGELEEDAPWLIASMLSAGLDRNAMRWGSVVNEGSLGWALLALAQLERDSPVDDGALSDFIGDDESEGQRKAKFLVAGLAGLGRLDPADAADAAEQLGLDFTRETPWSRAIGQAAQYGNAPLVALLAGLGMQGSGWEAMTGRHLFHIVRALDTVGLSAEARMIAAEGVTRG